MKLSSEMIRERFKGRGLKTTPQRTAIYKALAETTSHPTADDLYRQVSKAYPMISQNTVYYTLAVLRDAGLVQEVTLRRTILRDLDGIVHVIPNGEITVASNYTRDYSRVNLNISVGYGEDLDRAIQVINRIGLEMAEEPEWKRKIITPPQVLRVDNLGDSGIDLKILGDTKPLEQWGIMGELRLRLKRAFDQEGIEIPWPHTMVYFGNALPTGEGQAKAPPSIPTSPPSDEPRIPDNETVDAE